MIPFAGPYRPEFVGLGTLGFWVMLMIALSFPLKKRLGHRNWQYIHYLSYGVFGMVSVHALFAGTDGTLFGFCVVVGLGVMLIVLLLGMRMGKDQAKANRKPVRRSVIQKLG